VNKLLKENEVL